MSYSLFPKTSAKEFSGVFPKNLGKMLAWLVMAFGLFVIILGAVVKDTPSVSAQDATTPAVAEVPAVAAAPAEVPAVAAAPAEVPAVAAAPAGVPAVAAGPAEVPAVAAAPAEVPAVAAAPTEIPAVAAAPAEVPAVAAAPAEVPAAKGVKAVTSLIEQKKQNDDTSIFSRIMSIVGIFGFIGIAFLMSNNKKRVLWKLVAVGTALQLVFAIFILWTTPGKAIFSWLNDAFTILLGFTSAGTEFLFASFVTGQIESAHIHTAMSILPPIIFFSSLMTVLYYFGVMQWIVKGMAVFMMKFMGTSGSESLSSVANIFVGMTEAPLVVKPYVAKMTQSELFAVMTGGMATVAGGTMAAYVGMLQPFFPDIAGHLIAASVMSAPASLVVAKLMMPETEKSETMGKVELDMPKTDANVIDAAARGASEGMQLAINVGAMLLAFISIIALINFVLGLPSRVVNANTYEHVSAYVVQAGGELDEKCANPYSKSDTIACTHGALLKYAELKNITVDDSLKTLPSEQGAKIDRTEKLYDAVLSAAPTPNTAENAVPMEKKSLWSLLTLETILGWLFFPFAFLMGVPLSDCFLVGQLLGEKTAVNEFVAYLHLAQVVDQLSYRSIVISTYALCGFANFGSIAIQIGGIGGMAPERRSDIAKLGIKAMIAGTIAAFMTATIAGALI